MDRFFVGGNELRNDRIPRKAALDAIPTSCPEFRPSARVLCELSEDLRQGLGIPCWKKHSCVADDFRDGRNVAGDDGETARHRLDEHKSKPFRKGGEHEYIRL